MIKEALKFLLDLKRPENIRIGEKDFSTIDIYPIKEAVCSGVKVKNLDSLIKYLKDDPDNYSEKMKIVNIISSTEVIVESSIFGAFKQRETYIIADYSDLLPHINLDSYLSIEEFIIMLKSRFQKTEDLTSIIKIVGNISDENVTNYNDDGVTQKVTTKTGIARVGEVPLPPKITLKPFRTFIEVEQPESEFLLRGKKGYGGIEFALFEADGGAWKKKAIENISKYLEDNLQDIKNITILN